MLTSAENVAHTHTSASLSILVGTFVDIKHSLALYSYLKNHNSVLDINAHLNLILTRILKLSLNPQIVLQSCVDWPKCPHNAERSSHPCFKAKIGLLKESSTSSHRHIQICR